MNKTDLVSNIDKWLDTDGNQIQAHGGGVLHYEGKYYWYGEDKSGETISGDDIICGYRMDAIGVRCYVSDNLLNWENKGLVLASVDDSDHDFYFGNVLERPKVIYNKKNNNFVMWLHVDTPDYSYASGSVCVSDNPLGPFKYIKSVRPNNSDLRDMTIFKDDDEKAYLVHSSEWNKTLYISELDDDYICCTGIHTRNFVNMSREAPALFKNKERYYMITSGCTGWEANEALYAVSDSILGPWELRDNPCRGEDAENTFHTQSTFVMKVNEKESMYIAMFDRWVKEDLKKSSYVWLPVSFEEDSVNVVWYDRWELKNLINRKI